MDHGKELGKSQEKGATGSDRDLDNLNLSEHQGTVIEMTFQQESESGNQRTATQNANSELTSLMEPRYANPSTTANQDLRMINTLQQIPGDSHEQTTEQQSQTIQQSKDNRRAPGCIPNFSSA